MPFIPIEIFNYQRYYLQKQDLLSRFAAIPMRHWQLILRMGILRNISTISLHALGTNLPACSCAASAPAWKDAQGKTTTFLCEPQNACCATQAMDLQARLADAKAQMECAAALSASLQVSMCQSDSASRSHQTTPESHS